MGYRINKVARIPKMNISFRLIQTALLALPVIFFTGTKDPFLIKETLTLILLIGAFGFFIVNCLEQKNKTALSPVLIAFLIFIAVELISILNAKFPRLTVDIALIHLCLAFALFYASTFSPNQTETILNTVLVSGLIVCTYGIFQRFGVDFVAWLTNYNGRPGSSLGNPNFFAGFIVVLIPVAVMQAFKTSGIIKFSWTALLAMLLLNLVFTRTRGAWIACGASLIFVFSLLKFSRKTFFVFVSMLILVSSVFLFNNSLLPRLSKTDGNPAVTERFFKWHVAMEMIKAHPVLGVGAGNLKVNFALYQYIVKEKFNFSLRGTSESNVHNEFLQVWAESGTMGLLAFILLFLVYFTVIFKNNPDDKLTYGISAGVAAFIIFCLTNFPLRIMPTAVTLFVLMGISLRKPEIPVKEKAKPEKTKINKSPVLRITVFSAGAIIIWVFAILPFCADVYRKMGTDAVAAGNYQKAVSCYEKAISLDKVHSERSAFELGEVYRAMQDWDKPIKAYSVSVGVRNYGEVYNCLGNCYYMKNNPEQAVFFWEKAKQLGLPDELAQRNLENNLQIVKKKIK